MSRGHFVRYRTDAPEPSCFNDRLLALERQATGDDAWS
jgi:hypothetical protein